jgi:hypothetical protein
VGQLLSLPANTFLFGLQEKGHHLYIRPCYHDVLAAILAAFASGRTGALVSGIPGIGKSFFGAFLLLHYFGQNATIVYQDSYREKRWLMSPGAPVQEGGLQDFEEELKLATTIYICDVGGEGSKPPHTCNALTIVLSSPDPAHYKEWLKAHHIQLYMPVWSPDEVTAVVPAVYPERFLADGVTSIYPGRLKLYGGVARTIFGPETDDELKDDLDAAIKSSNLNTILKTIQSKTRISSLKLLQFVVGTNADGTPNYKKRTIDWASDEICELVMLEQEESRIDNETVSFLTDAAGKPEIGTMRGKIFERYAHGVLAAGGVFRARWENDATHTDISVAIPPTTQKGIVGDLSTLSIEVSSRSGD